MGGWVVGRWVEGRGSWVVSRVSLKIKKIYISSLIVRSKFVLGLRSCLFHKFPVVD